jgi:molybdopterin-guanine dinucleotide biosynthesis protein A
VDDFDAIVLAGGTARRLGGSPKHAIVVDGQTLLARTLAAVAGASHIIVVGDDTLIPLVADGTVVRENPPLAGPAAGIGAALPQVTAQWVMVLACDHPWIADAVEPLLGAAGPDGAIAVDANGRRQNLTFVARTAALRAAIARQASLVDLAVHSLIAPLELSEISVPQRALQDIDTWQDLGHG